MLFVLNKAIKSLQNTCPEVAVTPKKNPIVEGSDIIDIAKMIGITPAIATFIGMWFV